MASDPPCNIPCQPIADFHPLKRICADLCKCKQCSFCACTSEIEGDTADAQCQPWCALEYKDAHCKACKCRACAFCTDGAAPTKATPKAAHRPAIGAGTSASSTTSLAEAQQAPEQCTPHDEKDVSIFDCQTFCSDTYRDDHCALCKVRATTTATGPAGVA